ncbi:hypothetical protein [Exiguobacterium sp. s22]|uniref:hypothetical protein n=1 Tax=Exiguobacterium sp. s22 TaxID=2751272 RepID=UPI001BE93E62|nr:hypothetical protein [Exiguobacterium sp. s22]
MNPLLLNKNVHKILISSSSRFTGEFHSEGVCLDLCFPPSHSRMFHTINEHPTNRTFIAASLIYEHDGGMILPDLSEYGDLFCSLLSVLFGKEFKSHGLLESNGNFRLPAIETAFNSYYKNPQYNYNSRVDLDIPLDLGKFELLLPLLEDHKDNLELFNFQQIILAASQLYNRSLSIYLEEKELAFLDLITCGEILSNLHSVNYSDELLFDSQLLTNFEKISSLEGGDRIVRDLKKRLFQVKRKFTYSLQELLDDTFFVKTESSSPDIEASKLSKDNIEVTLKSAYDLRSNYVHSGVKFGAYLESRSNSHYERNMFLFSQDNPSLTKILQNAPTFLGLERILRFALLKTIHRYGIFISDELNE